MWTFNNLIISSLTDIPNGAIGFIYKIHNITTNKAYIGRKAIMHKKSLKPLKNKKRKRIMFSESDWLTYTGSNDILNQEIADGHKIEKEILRFCFSKKQMSYYELKYLMIHEVLESFAFYNGNISGKFFRKDVK